MPVRPLALAALLLVSGASVQAAAEEDPVTVGVDVSLLEVDAGAAAQMSAKTALDAVVRSARKSRPSALRVARYRSSGIQLGLMHQREGVRVVPAAGVRVVDGPARRPGGAWQGEEGPQITVRSTPQADGRIALRIDLGPEGTVRVLVHEGESVMVSGIAAPHASWPRRAPSLGNAGPDRTRLLFVTAHR